MGAKTVKRLAILIAVVILAGIAVFFIQRYQVGGMARSVLAQAEEMEKKAERAEKDKDFNQALRLYAEAESLYLQYLQVVPADLDMNANVKYADIILKGGQTRKRQEEAFRIYTQFLDRFPGSEGESVRRRLADLAVQMGQFSEARPHLEILDRMAPNNGHVEFLLGRCLEANGEDSDAEKRFRAAIENKAPEQLEAYQRRATLWRGKLNNPKEADKVIDEMMQSDPENYRVYLGRGRYRRQFDVDGGLKGAKEDFQTAQKKAPGEAEVYQELAETAKAEGRFDEARQFLEAGLKVAPSAAILYQTLASLELKAGQNQAAIEALRRGLKILPEHQGLHLVLAEILAQNGDSAELSLQIEELKKLGSSPILVDYLTSYYYININEWNKALELLNQLRVADLVDHNIELKARVFELQARCYDHLGDSEQSKYAWEGAFNTNPQNVQGRLGWINTLVNQGEIDRAIVEYRNLLPQVPQVWIPLTQLLIAQTKEKPKDQRDWKEVDVLINRAPQSVERELWRARLLIAQDDPLKAQAVLEQAQSQFPKSLEPWVALAELKRLQARYAEALELINQAKNRLGDQVGLRLERARIAIAQGGTEVVRTLEELAQNTDSLQKADRRKLLELLASEFARLNRLPQAISLWTQVAALEPNDLKPRLNLLELALQAENEKGIKENIDKIKEIEGPEGQIGRLSQIQYLIWQARVDRKKTEKPQEGSEDERAKKRSEARSLLNELSSRRPEWSVLPLAQAQLAEQELDELSLVEQKLAEQERNPASPADPAKQQIEEKKQKSTEIANAYLRAIDMGRRDLFVFRRVTELLAQLMRFDEMSLLWNKLPAGSNLSGNLLHLAADYAIEKKDFVRALDLARRTVTANPANFQERLWLVQVLSASNRLDEAETELRKAVELAKDEPDRRIALVNFLVRTRKFEQAEKAIQEAETELPKEKSLLALALCCEALGRAYQGASRGDDATKWYGAAKKWYEMAQTAKPEDRSITRLLVSFLVRTRQFNEAESLLSGIMKGGSDPKKAKAEERAWARRDLARILIIRNGYQGAKRALALFQPDDQPEPNGQWGKTLKDPDDLRILAQILDALKSDLHRERAIQILEGLEPRTPEDQFLLARLYGASNNWAKAWERYRAAVSQAEDARDETIRNRRSLYLAQFIADLLRHPPTSGPDSLKEAELKEAEELVQKLKQIQPNAVETLALEAQLLKAQNQIGKAVVLIKDRAKLPDLTPRGQQALADLAEKLGLIELAEGLYRQYLAKTDRFESRNALAMFLSRHGRLKDALDLCEPLWESNPPEIVAIACAGILPSPGAKFDGEQANRVASWIEAALTRKPISAILLTHLGIVRERQGLYQEAETLYRRSIEQAGSDAVSLNSRVVALNNLAQLTALKDRNGKAALELINRAIDYQGPLPDFLDTRGVIYLTIGDTKNAIADLDDAIAMAPSALKYFHLAQTYLKANNKEKAEQNLKKARALEPKPADLHSLEEPEYQKVLKELEIL